MKEFLGELARRAPHIALAVLAARKAGPMGLAAFEGGAQQAQQRQQELARQARLDEEHRTQQAAQEARLANADTRAAEQAEFQRKRAAVEDLWRAIQQHGETAGDPAAAETALRGQASGLESFYGVPQGQLAGMVPPMSGPVGRGVRKDVADLLANAERRLTKTDPEAEINDATVSFTWENATPRVQKWLISQGHPEGQPFKPSQLQAMSALPTITAPKAPKSEKNVPLEQQLLVAIQGGDKQLEQQIRSAMNARDAQMGGQTPRQRYSIQPITRPDGTTGLARVNVETGEVTVLNAGDVAFGKPTEGERKAASFYDRGSAADENALTFEDDLVDLGSQFAARLPNLLVSQKGQQYKQAQREFTEARLRSESGAAVPPSEYENDAKTYFIQPGDTPATIQQKQVARQRVLRGLKRQAGNLGATAKAPNDAGAEEWVRDPITGKLVKKGTR